MRPRRGLSQAANHSVLWLSIAACVALTGSGRARRAAAQGLASVAVASTVSNVIGKGLADARARPGRRGCAGGPPHASSRGSAHHLLSLGPCRVGGGVRDRDRAGAARAGRAHRRTRCRRRRVPGGHRRALPVRCGRRVRDRRRRRAADPAPGYLGSLRRRGRLTPYGRLTGRGGSLDDCRTQRRRHGGAPRRGAAMRPSLELTQLVAYACGLGLALASPRDLLRPHRLRARRHGRRAAGLPGQPRGPRRPAHRPCSWPCARRPGQPRSSGSGIPMPLAARGQEHPDRWSRRPPDLRLNPPRTPRADARSEPRARGAARAAAGLRRLSLARLQPFPSSRPAGGCSHARIPRRWRQRRLPPRHHAGQRVRAGGRLPRGRRGHRLVHPGRPPAAAPAQLLRPARPGRPGSASASDRRAAPPLRQPARPAPARALAAFYQREGGGLLLGCLPLLVQLPFFSVVYRLFLSHSVGGQPNRPAGWPTTCSARRSARTG